MDRDTAILLSALAFIGLAIFGGIQLHEHLAMEKGYYDEGSVCAHMDRAADEDWRAFGETMAEAKAGDGSASGMDTFSSPTGSVAGKKVADFNKEQQAEFDDIVRGLQAANRVLGTHPLFCDGGAIHIRGWRLKGDYDGALEQRRKDNAAFCDQAYAEDVLAYLKDLYPCPAAGLGG